MDPQYTLSDKSLRGTGTTVIKFGFRQKRRGRERELLQANDSMTGGSKIDPVFLALPSVLLVLWISRTDVGTVSSWLRQSQATYCFIRISDVTNHYVLNHWLPEPVWRWVRIPPP
jgi:hypothetical protein